MIWKPISDEMPPDGGRIFVLRLHWKNKFPTSIEIIGAIWSDGRADTLDDSGHGCWALPPEDFDWWCYADEMLSYLPSDFVRLERSTL